MYNTNVSEMSTKTETPAKKTATPKTAGAPKVKKEKAVPAKAAVVAAPAPEPVAAPEPVVEKQEEESPAEKTKVVDFVARLSSLVSTINALKAEYKAHEKKWTRELKAAEKANSKRKRRGGRNPSGFVKPTQISDEMAAFLSEPQGTLIARTDVTSRINTYIKANKLQDPTNGRNIIPDAKLTTLLKWNAKDNAPLSYFNLQTYLSPHFPKPVKA
jgi:chromatin remodeling complex protein RSC6